MKCEYRQDRLTLRYSKELPIGSWKSLDVAAEAVPPEERSWQAQQREIYAELSRQLKALFSGGKAE